MVIIAEWIESFNHSCPSFVPHDSECNFSVGSSVAASAGLLNLKRRSEKKNLSFHYCISILSVDMIDLPVVLVSPLQDDGPALDAWTCFPHEQTLGKGKKVLILCSFLRLIIHSTASSCYRCPALHPCSSHWGLTLKKTLLMVSCPEERRRLFSHFRTAAIGSVYVSYNVISCLILMWKCMLTNLVSNEQPGLQL